MGGAIAAATMLAEENDDDNNGGSQEPQEPMSESAKQGWSHIWSAIGLYIIYGFIHYGLFCVHMLSVPEPEAYKNANNETGIAGMANGFEADKWSFLPGKITISICIVSFFTICILGALIESPSSFAFLGHVALDTILAGFTLLPFLILLLTPMSFQINISWLFPLGLGLSSYAWLIIWLISDICIGIDHGF